MIRGLAVLSIAVCTVFLSGLGAAQAYQCNLIHQLQPLVLPMNHPHYEYHRPQPFDFGNSILFSPRSKWGNLYSTGVAMGRFSRLGLMHWRDLLTPVFQDSPAAKNLEMIRILEDINKEMVPPNIFEKEFLKEFGYAPNDMDFVYFYVNRHKLYKQGMEQFYKELAKVAAKLVEQLKSVVSFGNFTPLELKEMLLSDKRNGRLFGALYDFVKDSKAHIIELYSAVTIPDVAKVNFHIADIPEFEEGLQKKLIWMQAHPEELGALKKLFPHVTNNPIARRYEVTETQDVARSINFWVHSKEWDVGVKKAGSDARWSIIEIKRNAEPLTEEYFRRNRERHIIDDQGDDVVVQRNSIYDQSLETKEIFKFIGIDVDVNLLTTGGVDAGLKESLEKDDIHVLH